MQTVKSCPMSRRRAAAAARWSRASRPRPGPPSLACRWPLSSNKPPSWWLIRRVIVDALQAGLRFNFLLLSSDLLRTLGALCENNDYARGWCVCVSLTVTLRSVLECCAYECKGTGSRCSYGGFECWVTFRGPIVSTRMP